MRTENDRLRSMLWGAFVADAAAMGFHWLYEQDRIRAVAPLSPEFREPTRDDFEGVPGYFAHSTKQAGDLSHYGEQALVMVRAVAGAKGYSREAYRDEFNAHFGYGGTHVGYIDGSTRQTLDAMAREEDKGSDDVQMPAVAKLPGLVARHVSAGNLMEMVDDAVRMTNENDISSQSGAFVAELLKAALTSDGRPDLNALANGAGAELGAAIGSVLARMDETTENVTKDIGMACFLTSGLPSVVHNIATTSSYVEAIRTNIYAGGDNCGRGVILGAALGAVYGIGGDYGIPQEWIDRLSAKAEIAALIDAIV